MITPQICIPAIQKSETVREMTVFGRNPGKSINDKN